MVSDVVINPIVAELADNCIKMCKVAPIELVPSFDYGGRYEYIFVVIYNQFGEIDYVFSTVGYNAHCRLANVRWNYPGGFRRGMIAEVYIMPSSYKQEARRIISTINREV